MLTFVGLGLYDERDVSIKGLEAIKNADIVYAEFYTSKLIGTNLEKMEKIYGKRIHLLEREDIEINPKILDDAREKDVILLTGGDPMIATTHIDLRLRAIDMGIKTRIIHASSIFSAAVGLSGLQNYKFGRSATVAFPYKDKASEVPYDTVKMNTENGLHTFLYLDTSMTINIAIGLLLSIEEERDEDLLKNRLIVGIARVGSGHPIIKADYIYELKEYDFGDPLHVMIVPGDLHFIEREALVKFASAPEEVMNEKL
jgi:diphthine synthase